MKKTLHACLAVLLLAFAFVTAECGSLRATGTPPTSRS